MSTLTMFEASNPYDIVYAILGLAQDPAVDSERRQSAMYLENAYTPMPSRR
jgi:hypothetical protein